MKTLIRITKSVLFAVSVMTAQTQQFCSMQTITPGVQSQIVNSSQPVVLIFVDFPDGRLSNGNAPTQDSDTSLVANIDAVGSMGYTDPRATCRKEIRKYVYEDYWNLVFSQNQYLGASVHPDYSTHNGYTPSLADDPRQQPYDLTVYGSIRDYWNEVSYGNLQIQAYQTHSGSSDMYHTGIVNRIDIANGKNYIHWITLSNVKTNYANPQFNVPGKLDPIAEAINKVRSLHQLPINDPNYIEFDVDAYLPLDSYTSKIAIVYAGGMPYTQLGGWAVGYPSQECAVAEKSETSAYITNSTSSIILMGIAGLAHELGHTFGFPHFVAGSYDLMFWGGFGDRRYYFCPPHVNPKYKITMGWIPQSNIIKVNSDVTNVPLPSITSAAPQVALVTVYGDPGRSIGSDLVTNFSHSEYFIVEYRKRENFNRFVGGPNANSFTGGALVWHYSEYTAFPISGSIVDVNLGLKVTNYNNSFMANNGDPSQLYSPNNATLNCTSQDII